MQIMQRICALVLTYCSYKLPQDLPKLHLACVQGCKSPVIVEY